MQGGKGRWGKWCMWGSTNLSLREGVKEGGCCGGCCCSPQHRSAVSFSAELLHISQRQSSRTSEGRLGKEALPNSTGRKERKQPREVVRTGQDHPLCSFHGWTELLEILTLYYWGLFNHLSPASCARACVCFFCKIWDTVLHNKLSSSFVVSSFWYPSGCVCLLSTSVVKCTWVNR